jgi:hypothetical protein
MSIRTAIAIKRLTFLLFLLVMALAVINHNRITDWFKLQGYHPSATVTSLAGADSFTDQAEHLYYINRPEVVAKAEFRNHCKTKAEQTIVLGCYRGVQNGIYILKITSDQRLDGVMQVTAAHEMLHAAYDRLSGSDRQQVDGWLQDYYDNHLTDQRIKDTIAAYKQSEPDALVNEMHSIFGTEVAQLPAPLERYYERYFTDRSLVVALADKYQAEFTSRKQLVAQYDSRLDELKQLIEEAESSLQKQVQSIRADADRLQALRAAGRTAEYNAAVPAYNLSIDRYNSAAAVLKQQISQYNQLAEERNGIALEQQQLTQELSGDDIKQISN